MKLYTVIFTSISLFLCANGQEEEGTTNSDNAVAEDFLNSSFFAEVLENAKNSDSDAMGTQRVVDLEESIFSPSISFTTSYNYSSNPLKAADDAANSVDDGFSANFNFSFNMGLGEYPVGENILATPSVSLMHMRTYNDPVRDFGDDMKPFDVDVQILGFSLPLVLPDDFTLSLGYSYVRPIAFRDDNVINYSNTPSISFSRNIPLSNGDILTMSVGGSYTFSEGDTLEQQIGDPIYYQFISAVMESNGIDPISSQPTNLQDSWSNMINLSYLKPLSEKLSMMPSYTFSRMQYTEGANTGREDYLHNIGLSFSYSIAEWFNISTLSNYTWKKTDSTGDNLGVPEYEDFIGGIVAGFNYSF